VVERLYERALAMAPVTVAEERVARSDVVWWRRWRV
jgi:hypothetical protein